MCVADDNNSAEARFSRDSVNSCATVENSDSWDIANNNSTR